MNNIIIKDKRKGSLLISVLSLCVCSGSVNAQDTDSTFVREMLIEKEYTPVVKDADKIVRMPAVEAPQAHKTRIVYSDPKFKYVPDSGLENLSAGDVGTEYEFNKGAKISKGFFTTAVLKQTPTPFFFFFSFSFQTL